MPKISLQREEISEIVVVRGGVMLVVGKSINDLIITLHNKDKK